MTKPEQRELFQFIARTFWIPGAFVGLFYLTHDGRWEVLDPWGNTLASGWEDCP